MIQDIIILFTSYYFADKTDKVLTKENIDHKLMATPVELSEICGLCVRIKPVLLIQTLEILKQYKISYSGIYTYEKGKPCEKIENT